jgi:hypothetical protein
MAATQELLFDDAELLWARAQYHLAEYQRQPDPWRFEEVQDPETGEWLYGLSLDRANLRARKPMASDIANNLVHALDQVIAACARAHGTPRGHIYYPIDNDDQSFAGALVKLGKSISPDMIDLISRVRAADHNHRHLKTLKALSNSAKHWALAPPSAAINAAAIASPAGRVIFDIPEAHFEQNDDYLIHRTPKRLSPWATELLVGMRFSGLEHDTGADPMTVFRSGSRHVAEVLTQVTTLFGEPIFRPGPGAFL